jgi:hypothetical protein
MFKNRFMPMFDLDDGVSVANGADSPTADGEQTPDNQSEGNEPSEPAEPNGEPNGEPGEAQKDITETQAFAKRLREKTAPLEDAIAEKEKRIAELEALANGRNVLYNTLTECGFEGSEQEMADIILAQSRQLTPEDIRAEREKQNALIQEAIKNDPTFRQAQLLIEQNRAAAADARLREDLRQIQLVNPNVKSLDDLQSEPEWGIINAVAMAKIQSGGTLADAYKEVHKLRTPTPHVDTKSHLNGRGGSEASPDGLVDIPSNELSLYKSFWPDLDNKALRAKYNNILKRQKGE